ncbi:MAG: DUF177 domain-containing protein [Peptostreptococcaceae bacterium]|nr:DUF177 domain-containing protein [Peptostreptococcaceae bacterium]
MDLRSILNGERLTLNVDIRFDPDELDDEHGIRYLSPLDIKGIIRNTGSFLELKAKIATDISVDCARCLAEVELPIDLDVEAILMTEDQRSWDDEYDSFVIEKEEIDMASLASSEILQFIPLQPLCSEGCHGLCSGCGADLNEEECTCEEQTDSRFDILKQLLNKGGGPNGST